MLKEIMKEDRTKIRAKIKLFSLKGIIVILKSISDVGINLFTILKIASKLYPSKKALFFENESYSYRELYEKANSLRALLYQDYALQKRSKAGFFCSNSPMFIFTLFALSRLGLDIYFMNYEQTKGQFTILINRFKFDFIIYDINIESYLDGYDIKRVNTVQLRKMLQQTPNHKFTCENSYLNKIVVLTSGTTGIASTATRKTSILDYLIPFKALSVKFQVSKYQSFYIATPIYHGFGLVSLLISLVLGKEIYISSHFDAESVNQIIQKHKIETISLVPIMLQRMVNLNITDLKSLKCIISGGAKLPPFLVGAIQKLLETVYLICTEHQRLVF